MIHKRVTTLGFWCSFGLFFVSVSRKRPDNQDKIFDASAYFKQQQLEQEQLQILKDQQKALHLEQEHSGGSSQAPLTPSHVN